MLVSARYPTVWSVAVNMLRTVRLPSRLAVDWGLISLMDRYRLPRLVAEDAEDGAPRNAEARGQLGHRHARRPLPDDLRVARLVEEGAQAPPALRSGSEATGSSGSLGARRSRCPGIV